MSHGYESSLINQELASLFSQQGNQLQALGQQRSVFGGLGGIGGTMAASLDWTSATTSTWGLVESTEYQYPTYAKERVVAKKEESPEEWLDRRINEVLWKP